jgi:tyrosyl-tRNA synthetase
MLEKEEIDSLIVAHREAPHERQLQKRLAKEVTSMVHSPEEYEKAVGASQILFGGATSEALRTLDEQTLLQVFEGVPTFTIAKSELEAGIDVLTLCAERCKLFASKGELRKLIQGGGVSVNKEKVTDANAIYNAEALIAGKYLLVQKGKKNYFLIIAE